MFDKRRDDTRKEVQTGDTQDKPYLDRVAVKRRTPQLWQDVQGNIEAKVKGITKGQGERKPMPQTPMFKGTHVYRTKRNTQVYKYVHRRQTSDRERAEIVRWK